MERLQGIKMWMRLQLRKPKACTTYKGRKQWKAEKSMGCGKENGRKNQMKIDWRLKWNCTMFAIKCCHCKISPESLQLQLPQFGHGKELPELPGAAEMTKIKTQSNNKNVLCVAYVCVCAICLIVCVCVNALEHALRRWKQR